MKAGYIVAIVIAILVVVGGVIALNKKDEPANTTSSTTSQTTSTDTTPPSNTSTSTDTSTPSTDNLITYNGSSFSPSKITVKAGTVLTIKNDSSSSLDFDSDPHPSHTDNPELNVDNVSPGQSKTFTVNKIGTWGYHNHLNPTQKGTIVVQ